MKGSLKRYRFIIKCNRKQDIGLHRGEFLSRCDGLEVLYSVCFTLGKYAGGTKCLNISLN